MAPADHATFNIGHPAPHRGEIGWPLMTFALVAAPLAWSLQLLLTYGFASMGCWPGLAGAAGGSYPAWLDWLLPTVNLVALVLAVLGLAVSFHVFNRTRREQEGRDGGMMDAGEGRTRFLSIWGVWMGSGFALAIAFNTLAAFWTELCA